MILICAVLCLGSQCKKSVSSNGTKDEALAIVAGQRITAHDLQAEAEWRMVNNQAVPEPETLLKEMVNRLALVERAKQSGVAAEPDTRRRIESLLIARLREQHLDALLAKVEVSDAELRAAYAARSGEFSRKGLDRFSILFQAAQSKMSEGRRAEASKRLEAALTLADANPAPGGRGPAAAGFGAVAIDYSDDQTSRYRGGDIGWIEADVKATRWPAAVLEAGRALAPGTRSGILESEEGYFVIMKTDSRPAGVRPFEEISERLRQSLRREKQRACEERFVAESLALAKVEMNAAAARNVTLPVSKRPNHPSDQPPDLPEVARPAAASR
jgi:hypothetical protein